MTLITCKGCGEVEEVSDVYAHTLTVEGQKHFCSWCIIEGRAKV